MKTNLFNQSFCFAALIAFAEVLHAQGCAGGVGGGMDATGNECSDPRWQTSNVARSVLPVAEPGAALNARSTERPASKSSKAASKDRPLPRVDGQLVAQRAASANHPLAR